MEIASSFYQMDHFGGFKFANEQLLLELTLSLTETDFNSPNLTPRSHFKRRTHLEVVQGSVLSVSQV